MKSYRKAEALISAVRKSIKIPLTIKIRTGWESSGQQALQIAKIAEKSGADAISVHPRTATQGFSGRADWSVIASVKQSVKIPVIGNGDIIFPEDVLRMISETGCDAVMIGRGAVGNPWIFSGAKSLLRGEKKRDVNLSKRFGAMKRYIEGSVEICGETNACRMMRSRLPWFVKGFPRSSKFREAIKRVSTKKEAGEILDSYRSFLEGFVSEEEKR